MVRGSAGGTLGASRAGCTRGAYAGGEAAAASDTEAEGAASVILPVKVQTCVDELRRLLGLHPFDVSGFEINLDRDGIVQDVKPKLVYRRAKESVDNAGARV